MINDHDASNLGFFQVETKVKVYKSFPSIRGVKV